MGGSFSTSTNDELIDHLVHSEVIHTPLVEQVFRAVDRGNYFPPDQRVNAYKDIAWRNGNLHLSSPSVYAGVMEALKLEPGLSFLNLGSGTGYLNTMAGLILGPYGINHGIELYKDNVKLAEKILNDFMEKENAVDEYDFCEPSFIVGNCLLLDNNCPQYDRVYCGSSCPVEYEDNVKNLVKVGGILVMPRNENLMKMTRIDESRWSTTSVLSVPFAPLITPSSLTENESHNYVKNNIYVPPKLKHICRHNIRKIIKKNIDKDYPNLKNRLLQEIEKRRENHTLVISIERDNSISHSDFVRDLDNPNSAIGLRIRSSIREQLEEFIRRCSERNLLNQASEVQSHSSSTDNNIKVSNDNENWKEDANNKANSENKTDSEKKTKSENKAKSGSNSNPKTLICSSCSSFPSMSYDSLENDIFLPSSSKTLTSDELKQTGNHTSCRKQIRRRKASTKQAVKKRKLSRKRPASDDQGISDCQIRDRVKHTAATIEKEHIFPINSDSDMEEVSRNDNIAKEEDNVEKDSDDVDTYTKHLIKRIASLPLPSSLILYLSYK